MLKTAQILDGKHVSQTLLNSIRSEMARIKLEQPQPVLPKLVVILVGENPASQVYVNRKAAVAHDLGLLSEVILLPETVSQSELMKTLEGLNADPGVHAILVQLPLPKHLNTLAVLSAVDPRKDVDGFHPVNLGRLLAGDMPVALPCTPAGIMMLLRHYDIPLEGRHAVIIGRSNIVGKPVGLLLLQEHATVTFCHSRTKDLRRHLMEADILVAAVGIPRMITEVKAGAVVVDVGINRLPDGKLVGDVDYDAVYHHAAYITPVPGGVGPMTIATLMSNTLALYHAATKI